MTSQEKILSVMGEEPQKKWSGFELLTETKLGSSRLYPALDTLIAEGRVEQGKEELSDKEKEIRPPRTLYWLTQDGIKSAYQMRTDEENSSVPALRLKAHSSLKRN